MENVEEIQTWGPLIPSPNDPEKLIPDPERAGETFEGFIKMLSTGIEPDHPALKEACEFLNIAPGSDDEKRLINGLGYKVDYRALRACDFGAPTIRKRFVLVARNDGKEIVWPKPTHGKGKGLKRYRTAADCIDWSIPCPSIFDRKKPLVENTLKRIARGLDKFVLKNPKPYILEMNFDNSFQDVDNPMSTQTSANHHYLITPNIVQANFENPTQDINSPLSTQTSVNKHFVVTPTLVECSHKSGFGAHSVKDPLNTVTGKACFAASTPYMIPIGYGEHKGQAARLEDMHKPLNTVVGSNKHFVVSPYLMHYYSGEDHASKADAPVPTVTVEPRHYLCTSNLCVLRKNMDGKDVREPLSTLTTSAGHFAEVRTHLVQYSEGTDVGNWPKVRELLNKYAYYKLADNEIILFEIKGIFFYIDDIGMRMLEPEELKLAKGFPKDYIIDIESFIKKKYSKAKQIARLGNAVCPPLATALVRANCPEMCSPRVLITVADLEKEIARSAV